MEFWCEFVCAICCRCKIYFFYYLSLIQIDFFARNDYTNTFWEFFQVSTNEEAETLDDIKQFANLVMKVKEGSLKQLDGSSNVINITGMALNIIISMIIDQI